MGIEKVRRKMVGKEAEFEEQIICKKGALFASATPISVLNPLGADCIITKFVVDVTTNPTATPVTMDCGVSAAQASSDTLIDGAQIGGAGIGTYCFDNITNKGTNGLPTKKWTSTHYLKCSLTGTPTGLVGNYYVWYRKA
jgi:hypothetical protein